MVSLQDRLGEQTGSDNDVAGLPDDPGWFLPEENDEPCDPDVATWARLRRGQAERAAERAESEGVDLEWLAELKERIDRSDAERGRVVSESDLAAASAAARNGIAVLAGARSSADGEIRSMAERALSSCLRMALPQQAPAGARRGSLDGVFHFVDRTLWTAAPRLIGPSVSDAVRARQIVIGRRGRVAFLGLMLVACIGGALAMAAGRYDWSMACLVVAVIADTLEGSIGRVSATETPLGRWGSCMAGHLAEYVFLAAIAVDQLGRSPRMSIVVLGALAVAQYGTFVRTSARVVGDAPSLSIMERAVRFLAIVGYGVLSGWSVSRGLAPVVSIALFGGFGLIEVFRVGAAMWRRAVDSVVTVVEANGSAEAYVLERSDSMVGRII